MKDRLTDILNYPVTETAAAGLAKAPDRYVRAGAGMLGTVATVSGTVAAQGVGEASDIMCSSGLGNVISLFFGLMTLGMLLFAAARTWTAVQKLGAARSDKKKEGREAVVGAGITFAGAWVFPLFAVLLDRAGVSTLSCIDFQVF
ncbi:hypothetical protein DMJ13_27345 [halophilic archaeon]|nr:hypothetical protein DMJ13_27345 [halophilic archaeon]